MLKQKMHSGFTLIELMVVVAVVGILASIAYPSYVEYIRKARRVDAQQHLMSLAQLNQQRFLDTRVYTDTLTDLMATPPNISPYYDIAITLNDGPPRSFTISATPSSTQALDSCNTLIISSTGAKTTDPANTKCW